MTKIQIIGVVILVAGVVLLGVVYHATNARLEQLSEPFSVRYSNQMMWYIALGLAAAVGGGLLVVMGNEGSISHPGTRGRDLREPARGQATRYLNVAHLAEHKKEAIARIEQVEPPDGGWGAGAPRSSGQGNHPRSR